MNPSIVFFDVDGVLIDGWRASPGHHRSWDASLEADFGIEPRAFRAAFFGPPEFRHASPMFACILGRRHLEDALGEVLPRLGYQGPVEDFIAYWFEKDAVLNDEVLELVRRIRASGAELYLATGQEHRRARYLWHTLGLSRLFDAMFYSAAIGYWKQDIRFFEAINQALRIGPSDRPLFFDDQPLVVSTARRAGWDAVLFRTIDDLRDHPRLGFLRE